MGIFIFPLLNIWQRKDEVFNLSKMEWELKNNCVRAIRTRRFIDSQNLITFFYFEIKNRLKRWA